MHIDKWRLSIYYFFLSAVCNECFPFRPDGEKKAYVRLAPDYDALDVANKVNAWIFPPPEVLSEDAVDLILFCLV